MIAEGLDCVHKIYGCSGGIRRGVYLSKKWNFLKDGRRSSYEKFLGSTQ